jgi:RNA polymerase sigma factor (sigma-70 family)
MERQDQQNQDDQSKDEINSIDDNEIIKGILKGDKNLYALIVRKYNQRLYRVGMAVINREADVEDVMQSAYIKAYENLNNFKFQSGFSTWLTKILVNESLMHLKKREQTVGREKSRFPLGLDQSAIDRQTPLMRMLNSELKIILETSIRGLPEKYRIVFVMREMENMSVLETMECLELSEANVKVRLNRAKVMLREKLREYLKDDEILELYKTHCDRMVDSVMEEIIKKDQIHK